VPKLASPTGEVVMKHRRFVWMLAGSAAMAGTVAVINWPDIMRYVRMREM
jgi:hypothetical protein